VIPPCSCDIVSEPARTCFYLSYHLEYIHTPNALFPNLPSCMAININLLNKKIFKSFFHIVQLGLNYSGATAQGHSACSNGIHIWIFPNVFFVNFSFLLISIFTYFVAFVLWRTFLAEIFFLTFCETFVISRTRYKQIFKFVHR
jgi:hypothetical protein